MATPNQVLAVQYARSGCRVIPCKHVAPNEKEPEGGLSWKDAASNDPATVEAWWCLYPDALVGLPCNQNNLVVGDCDRKPVKHGSDRPFVDGVANFLEFCRTNSIDLTGALTVETPSSGLHIIFSSTKPYSNSAALLPAGNDVRANGYIIAPGSVYPDGRAYRIISGSWETITPVPAALEPFLKPLGDKQADPLPIWVQERAEATEHEIAYAQKALMDECAKFAALPAGTRNDALNIAAHSIATMVAAGWLDRQAAWNALWEASASYRADDGDTAAKNTMKSGWKAGLLKPRTPLPVIETVVDLHNFTVSNPFQFAAVPLPLRRHVQRSCDFPVDALSDTLRHTVAAIVDTIQCPAALAAMSVLGVASLAVQAHADVVIPATGQAKPSSLFLMPIAVSGERKTSADETASEPIKLYEKQLNEVYANALPMYRNQFDAWESERTHILRDKNLPRDARLNKLLALGAKPEAPLTPMLTCSEPTIEGLYTLYQSGNPSLGLFSSEGAQFIGGHGMNDDARLRTAGALCCFWDGEAVKRVRAAQGETYTLRGRRLAMNLMVQPIVAEKFLSLKDLQGQGIFSRILVAYPESTIGNRLQHDKAAKTNDVLAWYSNHLLRILQLPFPLAAGTRNELEPRPLSFDTGASARWMEYADSIEVLQRPGSRFECIRGFAGKLVENASRIAGIMTLIEDYNATHINLQMLDRAIEIADYFGEQALSMFETARVSPDIRDAEKLLTWLQNDWHESHITVRVVSRKGPHSLSKTTDARNAINVLEEHGWLAKIAPVGIIVDNYAVVKDVWLIRRVDT